MTYFKTRKWQDWVFSFGEIVFLLSLLPSIFGTDKPAALTSITTGLMLCGFLFVHASFKLWMAFCLTCITATLWFVLAAQVLLQ
jgi:hypothetical protein